MIEYGSAKFLDSSAKFFSCFFGFEILPLTLAVREVAAGDLYSPRLRLGIGRRWIHGDFIYRQQDSGIEIFSHFLGILRLFMPF